MAYRRRSTSPRRRSISRRPARRSRYSGRTSRRSTARGSGVRTVRLVIEQAAPSSVATPFQVAQPAPRKAKF